MSAPKKDAKAGGGESGQGQYDSLTYDKIICKVMAVGDGAVGKTCMCHSYANNGEFLADKQEYIPTIFDNYQCTLPITDTKGETENVVLSLWDTAGQDEFRELRHMCFGTRAQKKPAEKKKGATPAETKPAQGGAGGGAAQQMMQSSTVNIPTSVFLVCFAVNNPGSFSSVQLKWYHELKNIEREMRQQNQIPASEKRPFSVILCGTKMDTRQGTAQSMVVSREEAESLARDMKADRYVECSARSNEGIKEVIDEAVVLWYSERAAALKKAQKQAKENQDGCTML